MAAIQRERRGRMSELLAHMIYCGLFEFHRGPVVIDGDQAYIQCKWCSNRVPAPAKIGMEWAISGENQNGHVSNTG